MTRSLWIVVVVLSLLSVSVVSDAEPALTAEANPADPTEAAIRAPGAVITVTTLEDELNSDGDCSLREAITAANSDAPCDGCMAGESGTMDTIVFDLGGTIILTRMLPRILDAGPLTIDGGGTVTIDGNSGVKAFWVHEDAQLTLQNLDIVNTDARGYDSYNERFGGAILVWLGGTVTVANCTFSNNSAVTGGAVSAFNRSALTITGSTFSDNYASHHGGAVAAGIWGTLDIADSTFSGNTSPGTGGGVSSGAELTIESSTFSGNSSTGSHGGGLWIGSGVATIVNSTFSGNSAMQPFNGWGGGLGTANESTVSVINSTFSGNGAVLGGGIYKNNDTSSTYTLAPEHHRGRQLRGRELLWGDRRRRV
jgi:CSLREA domain-containing protein